MTTNRDQDDELVYLEPERRSKRTGDGETATPRDRRAAGDALERRPSRRARRSERRSGRSGVAGVERERQRSGDGRGGCDAARERERNGTRVWGRGGASRAGRGLYAAPPDPTVGRRRAASTILGTRGAAGVGLGGWSVAGRADLVPVIGPLSGRQLSGRASGRPAVLGLRPKH
jgi:hypothetical protein